MYIPTVYKYQQDTVESDNKYGPKWAFLIEK